jgi:hypothetical protein
MTLENVERTRQAVVQTTDGLRGTPTLETGGRVYAPSSDSTGAGLVNAERAVRGQETTIVSQRAAIGTATALAGAGLAVRYLL